MTSLVIGEIKLCSGDVLCPAAKPGQSHPRLPVHILELELSEGCALITPKSWALSNPDSGLAACSRLGKKKNERAAIK